MEERDLFDASTLRAIRVLRLQENGHKVGQLRSLIGLMKLSGADASAEEANLRALVARGERLRRSLA